MATEALEEALDRWTPTLETLRRELRRDSAAYERRVAAARKQVDQASQERKIDGYLWRVALYETRLKMPDGVYELTPGVTAHVEEMGMVQTVQGWVFKSETDNREAYLHVDGPGWASVFRVNLKYAWTSQSLGDNLRTNTKELRRLAQNITTVARNVEYAREQRQLKMEAAQEELARIVSEKSHLERSLDTLKTAAAAAVKEIEQCQGTVRESLSGLQTTRGVRRSRKILERADQMIHLASKHEGDLAVTVGNASGLESLLQARDGSDAVQETPLPEEPGTALGPSVSSKSDVRLESAPIDKAARPSEHRPRGPGDAGQSGERGRDEAEGLSPRESLALIKELGELQEAGLVTAEEFEAKKRALLDRL